METSLSKTEALFYSTFWASNPRSVGAALNSRRTEEPRKVVLWAFSASPQIHHSRSDSPPSAAVSNGMAPRRKGPLSGNDDAEEPDIHALFCHYNSLYFSGELATCFVSWSSSRMTKHAGICYYKEGSCEIRLSEPLLKHRLSVNLKNVLLHEMIHAYLWIKSHNNNHGDHGQSFQEEVNRIESISEDDNQKPDGGYKITFNHDFHEEVASHRVYKWICKSCDDLVEKVIDTEPSSNDCIENMKHDGTCEKLSCSWHRHKLRCSGSYVKMEETSEFEDKKVYPKGEHKLLEDRPIVSARVTKQRQGTHKARSANSNSDIRKPSNEGISEESNISKRAAEGSKDKSNAIKSETITKFFSADCAENCNPGYSGNDKSQKSQNSEELTHITGEMDKVQKGDKDVSEIRKSKGSSFGDENCNLSLGSGDNNFHGHNCETSAHDTRLVADATQEIEKDKSDVKKSMVTKNIRSAIRNENRNHSGSNSSNFQIQKCSKGKDLKFVGFNTKLYFESQKASRSVRTQMSRKKRRRIGVELNGSCKCKKEYTVIIEWLDWCADEETGIEHVEPLINKRTERRKRQKLLNNLKEIVPEDESVPGTPCLPTRDCCETGGDESGKNNFHHDKNIGICNSIPLKESIKMSITPGICCVNDDSMSVQVFGEICDVEIFETKSPPSQGFTDDRGVFSSGFSKDMVSTAGSLEGDVLLSGSPNRENVVEISDG